MNRRCEQILWTDIMNRHCEQTLWTDIVNTYYEQTLWTDIVNWYCESSTDDFKKSALLVWKFWGRIEKLESTLVADLFWGILSSGSSCVGMGDQVCWVCVFCCNKVVMLMVEVVLMMIIIVLLMMMMIIVLLLLMMMMMMIIINDWWCHGRIVIRSPWFFMR